MEVFVENIQPSSARPYLAIVEFFRVHIVDPISSSEIFPISKAIEASPSPSTIGQAK